MAGGMQGAEKFRQQLRGSDKWYARAGGKVFGATVGATATTAMGAKFGSKQSVTDVDKEEKGYKKAYEENAWLEAAKKKVTSGTPIELERTVINATESQTAALLKAFEKNEAVYKQILGITPNNRIEKLLEEKNEQLDDTKKNLLKTRRNGVIDEKLVREENARRTAEAAKTGSTPILVAQIDDDKRMVAQAMVGDLEARGFEFVEKYAGYLTAAQIEDMKKNKNFVESELKKIDAARAAYFEGLVAATNPTRTIDIQNEIKSRKPKDAAKLPEKILADAAATPQLSIDILNAIIADNSVEYATQRKVVANVRTMLAGTQTPDPTLVKYINSSRMQERYP